METKLLSDPNIPYSPNGRVRVAAWSPYKRLERALYDLIGSMSDVEVVELKEAIPVPQALCQLGLDIVVLDVDGAPDGARELIGQIRRSVDNVSVLAVSGHHDPRFIKSALDSGATGYVLKDRAFEDLPNAVRAAASAKLDRTRISGE